MILAIPLFVLALGVFHKNANRLLHREAVDKSRTILSTTTQLVVNYLNSVECAARSNLWMLEENFNPDSLAVNSRRIVSLNKSVLSCSVAAEPNTFPQYGENFSVYTVNDSDTIISEFEPEFEYFEKNWYKKPMQTGKPCWITPFSDFNAGVINHHDAVGSFCMPIRPHGNKIEGVVSVDFSFKKLRETILATHHPYPSSYYMILGPVGGYLIHPDNSLLFKKTIFTATDSVAHPDIIALGREMIAHKHGTMHVTIDDVLCHVTYMPITDTGWSIALVCHDEDVLADYNNLTIVMIIIVIIGILIITWITKNVVQNNMRPLNKLLEATKIISEGNYATVIEVSKHKDSIGKLQNAFRKMQLAIMANMSELLLTKYDTDEEIKKLEQVLPLAEEAGLTILVEPLSGKYFRDSKEAFDILREVNSRNILMLYDIFHFQQIEGNITNTIKNNIDWIGHIHGAGVPARCEITDGEVDYRFVLNVIKETGYDRYFGLEFFTFTDCEEKVRKSAELLRTI
jgi:HAMP domain-containing protein